MFSEFLCIVRERLKEPVKTPVLVIPAKILVSIIIKEPGCKIESLEACDLGIKAGGKLQVSHDLQIDLVIHLRLQCFPGVIFKERIRYRVSFRSKITGQRSIRIIYPQVGRTVEYRPE